MKKRNHADKGDGRMRKLRLGRVLRRDHEDPRTMSEKALTETATTILTSPFSPEILAEADKIEKQIVNDPNDPCGRVQIAKLLAMGSIPGKERLLRVNI